MLSLEDTVCSHRLCVPDATDQSTAFEPIRLTACPDASERAFFLTVPSPAAVKSLGGERSLDAGSAEVRLHVHQVVNGGLNQQEYGCLATELAHNQC